MPSFLIKGLSGHPACHLHVCELNSAQWNEKIVFRDYLRSHPKEAQEYYILKLELASQYTFDRSTYTNKKGLFIKYIIEKAIKDLE